LFLREKKRDEEIWTGLRLGVEAAPAALGVDQAFPIVFFGASYLRRDRTIPEATCPAPDPFAGCSGVAGTELVDRESKDDLAAAYVNVLIGKLVAASTVQKSAFTVVRTVEVRSSN